MLLLVRRELRDGNAGDPSVLSAELHLALLRGDFDQRLLALFPRELLEELVGFLRLMPEDVAGMPDLFGESRGRVAVENRPAERDVLGAVAVAADRQMPARHHEFELAAAGSSEN